jgi:16S rRNA (uracil1498-N3)-methyltransferase
MALEITGRRRLPEADIHVTLCQGVPKAEKMDGIVRHATELGAERIIPFLAERSVPRWQPEQFPRKRERWQKIAVEASRQCGRPDIPEIGAIVTFERMLHDVPGGGLRLIPWEEETTTDIREVLRDPSRSGLKEFVLVIGPEGGFSAGEIEMARQAGFLSVSLGKRVLRVETASLALLSILQYERGGRETESMA